MAEVLKADLSVHCEDVSLPRHLLIWFKKRADYPIARQEFQGREGAGKKGRAVRRCTEKDAVTNHEAHGSTQINRNG